MNRTNLPLVVSAATALLLIACTEGQIEEVDSGAAFDGAFEDAGPDGEGVACDPDVSLGDSCERAEDCDDGCYCNGIEACVAGTCAPVESPCVPDALDCTIDACDEELDRCTTASDDSACQDDDACNGAEVCDLSMGCVAGSPPSCNDDDPCTLDRCDAATGCVHDPRDLDGDGYADATCGGGDCDEVSPRAASVHPGAIELCENGLDDDCDARVDGIDEDCAESTGGNDTCATARLLPGPGSYTGTMTGLRQDYVAACSPYAWVRDAVYRIRLTETRDLHVGVTASSATAILLRPFGECATGPDRLCASERTPLGVPVELHARSLPAGDYALIVSSVDDVVGLTIDLPAPTSAPLYDRCEHALDVGTGGVFTGLYPDVVDDYDMSCHIGGRYRDAVHRVTLSRPTELRAVLSTTHLPGRPPAYLGLYDHCPVGREALACIAGGPTAVLDWRMLPAGTYYLVAESSVTESGATGAFELTVGLR